MYGVSLPQGFDGNKEDFAYCSCVSVVVNGLWFILGIIEVYLQIRYRYLTIHIRALSLAGVVGNYFLFLQKFFSEKKKEGRDIPDIFSIFL